MVFKGFVEIVIFDFACHVDENQLQMQITNPSPNPLNMPSEIESNNWKSVSAFLWLLISSMEPKSEGAFHISAFPYAQNALLYKWMIAYEYSVLTECSYLNQPK